MKAIRQKGREYVEVSHSFETVIDAMIYNPKRQKRWNRRYQNGTLIRRMKGITKPFEKLMGYKFRDFTIYLIAQSHLDAAWLFPVMDGKIRAYKTFYKAIEHIEKYPFFTFAQTSPQYYQWIKVYDPKLWEKVKTHVKSGKFEPIGGMWIESTLDEPWGESLVRQRLYGQHFYLREFGRIAKVSSLLDVFGFPHSLPQILTKSGAEFFYTTKNTWNEDNLWPMSSYIWRGVDGSDIFTYQFKFHYMALLDLKLYDVMGRFPKPEYYGTEISSHMANEEIEQRFSKERMKEVGIFYGWGDGAKGPHERELTLHHRIAELHRGKMTTAEKFFRMLRKRVGDRYLVWDDEQYLETHRGTKTTVNAVKHYNRKGELWAFAAESLLTLINLGREGEPHFNKPFIFEIWRRILFNQFHDILPGSSIPDVYLLAIKEQKEAITDAKAIISSILSQIKKEEDMITVYNPFNWPRSEYLIGNDQVYYIEDIPPFGIDVYPKQKIKVQSPDLSPILMTDSRCMFENELLKADINLSSGNIVSLKIKLPDQELIPPGGESGFKVYREKMDFMFPSWNIDPNYQETPVTIRLVKNPYVTTLFGKIPAVSAEYQFLESKLQIWYYLLPKDPYLRIKIRSDVKDPELLVKFFIPLTVESSEVTAEIPYASIKRSRIPHSEMEESKWEASMQKWVDISDARCGLSILNDNRYGYSASEQGISITLTRTPVVTTQAHLTTYRYIPKKQRPKYADLKPFEYNLGLYPHINTNVEAETWKHAYNFNLPLITNEEKIADIRDSSQLQFLEGQIDRRKMESLFKINNPNILVGAIKPSEWEGEFFSILNQDKDWNWDGKSFIIRMVEQAGASAEIVMKISKNITVLAATEVDLLEMNPGSPLPINKNEIRLEFHKYEIKTLRLIVV